MKPGWTKCMLQSGEWEKSTMLLYSELKKSEETLEDIGLDPREYSYMGGGFPIRVEEVGVIGAILVSNQNHFVNHDIIVRAVSRYLHVDEVPRIRALWGQKKIPIRIDTSTALPDIRISWIFICFFISGRVPRP